MSPVGFWPAARSEPEARKLLRRASFTSKEHLKARIEAFIAYFNRTLAKPFKWTMTGKPLAA